MRNNSQRRSIGWQRLTGVQRWVDGRVGERRYWTSRSETRPTRVVLLSLVLSVCLTHASTFSLPESSSQRQKAKPAGQPPASARALVK
jgi:hypothetical protein